MFFVFLFSFFSRISLPHFSNANQFFYAKITGDNTYFFSKTQDDGKLFLLPKSYFVILNGIADENFYSATYKDLNGYVLKSEVLPMKGKPTSPFLNASLKVFSTNGTDIYRLPSTSLSLATIPYSYSNLTYYGLIHGESLSKNSDNWVYCCYQNDSVFYGYVYSLFCDNLPNEQTNSEVFPVIENPFSTKTTASESLSKTSMVFIILGVSLPCVVVLYLLVKPTFMKEKVLNPTRKKQKRHGDYFEFDESDLN